MCLFNREIQGFNCGHDECKNYYLLNKHVPIYGFNQSSSSNNTKSAQNVLPKHMSQVTPPPQKAPAGFNPSFEVNAKRTRLSFDDIHSKETEEASSNKLIKTEAEGHGQDLAQRLSAEIQRLQSKASEANQFAPNSTINNPADKNLLNNLLMNNLLLASSQGAGNLKPDPNLQKLNNQNVLLSLLQQNSANNLGLNTQAQALQSAQQPNLSALAFPQLFPQASGIQAGALNAASLPNLIGPDMNINQELNKNALNMANLINDMKMKSETTSQNDEFLKEFQGRIMGLLFQQNKMLADMKEKNDGLQNTLAVLINEVNNVKNHSKHGHGVKDKAVTGASTSITSHQFIGSNAEVFSVEDLTTFLYGANPDFQYQLILKSDLSLPLYRERNFKFSVILTDKNGNPIENSNRIPLTIGLYTSENPPKYIDANTAGNKILKGILEKDLTNGTATFEKIQIKEVTSHFRNGWIFFVVYPKVLPNNASNSLVGNGNIINSQKIKPLILEKVIVKAKKAKEKEQAASDGNEAEDNPSLHNEDNPIEEGLKS